jgi:hypothetical protein
MARDERLLRIWKGRYRACMRPPVMGPMKRNSATSRSASSPAKRSMSAAGSRLGSTGGMNAARATFQNGVAVKLSRHHVRHRSTVRRSTPITWVSSRMRSAVAPCPHRRQIAAASAHPGSSNCGSAHFLATSACIFVTVKLIGASSSFNCSD